MEPEQNPLHLMVQQNVEATLGAMQLRIITQETEIALLKRALAEALGEDSQDDIDDADAGTAS